jgi:hypothetical protein
VAPLRLGGLSGKQITPSVGWEVPMRSQQSVSRIAQSARTTLEAGEQEKVHFLVE